jgi:hypothetical protein
LAPYFIPRPMPRAASVLPPLLMRQKQPRHGDAISSIRCANIISSWRFEVGLHSCDH